MNRRVSLMLGLALVMLGLFFLLPSWAEDPYDCTVNPYFCYDPYAIIGIPGISQTTGWIIGGSLLIAGLLTIYMSGSDKR